MEDNLAIQVNNISKTFKIPHEKITSLRGAFVNLFKKNSYEEFKALDDVSFEVKKGEFFGIIGRNGSGKSTLLKILAGIYEADKGKARINGLISPFLELGIGFNPELSGRDNVYLNASVLGLSKKQIDKKFDDIVRFSELERFIDQKLKNYSSGMQVRLAFSVAIHANRDILLMDEVLAVGDVNFQSKCLTEFSKYRHLGKTVILVTHDILTVQQYCDRAMLLRNGKISMIGNPEKVGNEYIYQNMSDEEKRIILEEERRRKKAEKELERRKEEDRKEEEKRKEEKVKNKMAEITSVKFLDKNGKEKYVFETGDEVSVRVNFKQNKKTPILNFGIAIRSIDNDYVFGTNTFIDKVDVKNCIKRGYFEIKFPKVPLKSKSYYATVGIYGENKFINYDLVERTELIKFFSHSKSHGIVDADYNWI